MIHIVADAKYFGSLDACSAWVFENYLYQVKRMLRSGYRPLEQVIRRLAERNNGVWAQNVTKSEIVYSSPDNAFVLDNRHCCLVLQPVLKQNKSTTTEVECAVYDVCALYTSPCDSSSLGSFKACGHPSIAVIECVKLKQAAMCLTHDNDTIFLRLRHRV